MSVHSTNLGYTGLAVLSVSRVASSTYPLTIA